MDSPSNLVGVGKYRYRACDFKLLRVGELADFKLADLDWFDERWGKLKASHPLLPTENERL